MGDECPICLEPIHAGVDVCETKCSHRFHTSCLCRAFVTRSTCPICRAEIATQVDTNGIQDAQYYARWLAEIIAHSRRVHPEPRTPLFRYRSSPFYRSAAIYPSSYPNVLRARILHERDVQRGADDAHVPERE